MAWFRNLEIRWKLLAVVLPLVVLPILAVSHAVGYLATQQTVAGMTRTSEADLAHMAQFTVDLLTAHVQQFEVYREDKATTQRRDLAALLDIAYGLVADAHRRFTAGEQTLEAAHEQARHALRRADLGEFGYLYAITSNGVLVAHPAQEGENIYGAVDPEGRTFIREMCEAAVAAPPGEVGYTVYPWSTGLPGEHAPRHKLVAYRYFADWDWVIAAGSYVEQDGSNSAFERASFAQLKQSLHAKRVGSTGYIYAIAPDDTLTIHPTREGKSLLGEDGRQFFREMSANRSGWLRYAWQAPEEPAPRRKVVRYEYFAPWDWIIAVGAYEDELLGEARTVSDRVFRSMRGFTVGAALVATLLVIWAAQVLTAPIRALREGVRRVGEGSLAQRIGLRRDDELGELAKSFDRMTEALRQRRALDQEITQQSRLASLGVMASGVAHEINNPLGVILGFAGYLEMKLPEADPNRERVTAIRRESQHCRGIVQDLLHYARLPAPRLAECDLELLLDQTLGYAAQQAPLQGVAVQRCSAQGMPTLPADRDQLRQVLLHLLLNAGEALNGTGIITVTTRHQDHWAEVEVADTGPGIAADELERVFEPFHTHKPGGTGLGLAICRQIVESHHGEIQLHSAPGEGTRVRLRLPLTHEEF